MTTAPGHSGVTTVGPEKSHRWLLMLALVAITAVGIAAVTMIINQADTGVSTTPAVVAPVEVAPAPVEVPAAAALIAPVLEAPLSLQELALMNEAATGLVPAGVLAQEMALGVEKALESTALSVQELALMNEAATGLVPTGILADEMAIGHEFGYEATALSGLEYALMNEAVTGLVPTGILADEMALAHEFGYEATTALSGLEYALMNEAATGLVPTGILADEMAVARTMGLAEAVLSADEFALMNEALTGFVPTGVLADEMALGIGFDYSATIGNTSMSPIVNALIAADAARSYISLEEYEFISEVLTGLVPTGVLADEMAFSSGFDYSATIGNTSMSPIVSALIGAADRSYISLEEYEFISEILRGLVPTGVLEDEMTTP